MKVKRQWVGFAVTAFAAVTAVSLRAGHHVLPQDLPIIKNGGYSVLMAGMRQADGDLPIPQSDMLNDDAILSRRLKIPKPDQS